MDSSFHDDDDPCRWPASQLLRMGATELLSSFNSVVKSWTSYKPGDCRSCVASDFFHYTDSMGFLEFSLAALRALAPAHPHSALLFNVTAK